MITERDKIRILRQNARTLLSSKEQYEYDYVVRMLVQFSILMGTDKAGVDSQVLEIIKGTEQNIKATNERIAQTQAQEEKEVNSVMLDFEGLENNNIQL